MNTRRAVVVVGLVTYAGLAFAPASWADDDKYTQTWPTPYSQTTCSQFLSKMTAKQRWVMAADMLTSARNMKEDAGLPSDAMVAEFEGGLDTACVIGTMTMDEVGVGLYMTEPRFYP